MTPIVGAQMVPKYGVAPAPEEVALVEAIRARRSGDAGTLLAALQAQKGKVPDGHLAWIVDQLRHRDMPTVEVLNLAENLGVADVEVKRAVAP